MHGNAMKLQTSTGGSCRDGVVVLGVKVDDFAAHEKVLAQLRGARHAIFLIGGGDHFQRPMHNLVALQHSQSHRQSDAVVGSQ